MKRIKKHRFYKTILVTSIALFLIIVGVFVYLLMDQAVPSAMELKKYEMIEKQEYSNYTFFDSPGKDTTFIFLNGGKVDPRAYAYLAKTLNKSNIDVFYLKAPFNLHILTPFKTSKLVDEIKGEYKNIYIGGHSLGGTVAGLNTKDVDGIVFMASYPFSEKFKHLGVPTLNIYGTNDGLISPEKREKVDKYMPFNSSNKVIEGANHGQFGNYGKQKKDLEATIDASVQQKLITKYIIEFIELNNSK